MGMFLTTGRVGRNSSSSVSFIWGIFLSLPPPRPWLMVLIFFLRLWDILRLAYIFICLPVKYKEYCWQQSHGPDFCPIRAKGRLGFIADCAGDLPIGSWWLGCAAAELVEDEVGHISVFTSDSKCFLEMLSGFVALKTMLNTGINRSMVIFILVWDSKRADNF